MRLFHAVMFVIAATAITAKADVTGSILGTVRDPAGGLVVDAEITAVNSLHCSD